MKDTRLNIDSPPSRTGGLFKPGILSLLLHVALVIFLLLSLKTPTQKHPISVYRVSILRLGTGTPPGGSGPAHSIPGGGSSQPSSSGKSRPAEIPKKVETPKKTEAIEAVKRDQKKPAQKVEPAKKETPPPAKKPEKRDTDAKTTVGLKSAPHKEEKPKEDGTDKSLRDALADIQRKVALDDLQKRIAQRGTKEKAPTEGSTSSSHSQGSSAQPSKGVSPSGSGSGGSGTGTGQGSGPGTGSGSGTGKGTGVGPGTGTGGSPWGSAQGATEGTLLDAYYTMLWAKIKAEWTIPENLPKGGADLETVIVVIIERNGKIQKSWFEKKSGNSLYDQMAMRAIKKAEPLPPIPKEFSDPTFEVGIRFLPD
jgi:colicin import membrane protein